MKKWERYVSEFLILEHIWQSILGLFKEELAQFKVGNNIVRTVPPMVTVIQNLRAHNMKLVLIRSLPHPTKDIILGDEYRIKSCCVKMQEII